ncbi:hypothetical protein [Alkalicoccus saliphilus]|nr:hypothetical protein [Alkalicoccus saliphilus]
MEEGKFSLHKKWIDLQEVVENIHPQIELKAKKRFGFSIGN